MRVYVWISDELKRSDLTPEKRAALEKLEARALAGKLEEGELDPYRRRKHDSCQRRREYVPNVAI